MAKRSAKNGDGLLGDWLDDVPEAVQEAADAYDKAHAAKTRADGKCNTAKENVIAAMKEHNVPKCRIRNGEKVLELSSMDKVRIRKPEASTDADSNGDAEGTAFDAD